MEHGIFPNFASTRIFFKFWNMEYSKKSGNIKNIEIGGIWNIRGIFLKNSKTIKISIIFEYGILHGIFLEYSKMCKTSNGGVKFNQDFMISGNASLKSASAVAEKLSVSRYSTG